MLNIDLDIENHIKFVSEDGKLVAKTSTELKFKNFWQRVKFAAATLFSDVRLNSYSTNLIEEILQKVLELQERNRAFNVKKTLPEAIIPTKAHDTDAGWDLYLPQDELVLNPGETKRVNFGIVVDIQPGYAIYVMNRSGLVWKYSTMMTLGVGLIDEGYIGEIKAPFYNFGDEQMRFQRGDRMAQLVIKKTEDVRLVEGTVTDGTERGSGGFGSSGR